MKSLVTGATGFIGSAVVRELLARGQEVRVLVREQSDTSNIEGLDVEVAYGDVRDAEAVREAMRGCDVCYHLAAIYKMWLPNPKVLYDVNVGGTKNVLRAALEEGVGRVVYTSTAGFIVSKEGRLANEKTPVDLSLVHGHYLRSKYLAELEAMKVYREGLPLVVVNPTLPLGPRDRRPTPSGKMVIEFLRRRIPGYLDGGLNLIAVEDVASGHFLAAEKGKVGERYILGNNDGNLSLKEIFALLEKVSGVPAPRIPLPYPLALLTAYGYEAFAKFITKREPLVNVANVKASHQTLHYDCSKAVEELGLPQTPVEDAVRRAVEWYREQGYV
jgi:dihydroflavonol-4-reductase